MVPNGIKHERLLTCNEKCAFRTTKKTINLHDALKNKHNYNIYIYITLDYSLYLDYT